MQSNDAEPPIILVRAPQSDNDSVTPGANMLTKSSESVLTPYKLGDLDLPNRVVMAPLARNRAAQGGVRPRSWPSIMRNEHLQV
jgi:hypothetical protein